MMRRSFAWAALMVALLLPGVPACGAGPGASYGPSAVQEFEAAKRDTAKNEAEMLQSAATMFVLNKQACPASVAELAQAKMIAKHVVDPWNNEYVVVCEGQGDVLTVHSKGPDGIDATDDDVPR